MLADLATDSLEEMSGDVCVVGAGPVGITLAISLRRAGVDVILLESGGPTVEPEAQELNAAHVTGRPHHGIHDGRFRALGGTSTRWGGQILPLESINFEMRPWIERSGWPIAYEEIEPYYTRALAIEGLQSCAATDDRVWRALRLPQPDLGGEIGVHTSRWCPEPDFGRLHRQEITSSPNLRCVLHASVTAISVAGDTIQSVVAKNTFGRTLRVKARRFAFCGGAIETARLLLHPTEEGAVPPWGGDDSLVGRCFQDHPTFECADVIPRNAAAVHRLMDMVYLRGLRYQPRLHLTPGAQRRKRSLSVGGFFLFKSANAERLSQLRIAARNFLRSPRPATFLTAAREGIANGGFLARQGWRYAFAKRALNPHDLGIRLIAFAEQPPRVESAVTLAGDADALGMRRAALDWRIGSEELSAVGAFADAVHDAFSTRGVAELRIEPALAGRDPSFLDRGWDNYHHIGTTRAADDRRDGVVDRNLKIFGTANGFVCGCAVFPTSGFSNPTHTAIALAIRLADHLTA